MFIAPSNEVIYTHSQTPFRERDGRDREPRSHQGLSSYSSFGSSLNKNSILYFLDTIPHYSMFRELIKQAQFEDLLGQEQNTLTLFIPNNESLTRNNVSQMGWAQLKDYVGNHIAQTSLKYEQLRGVSAKIPSYNKYTTDLSIRPERLMRGVGDGVLVNGRKIIGQKCIGRSMIYEIDGCL